MTNGSVDDITYEKAPDAVRYLLANGWKVSERSFYRHVSASKIGERPWTRKDLDEYAVGFLNPQVQPAPGAKKATRSAAAELIDARKKKIAIEIELKNHELAVKKGEYIERAQVYRDLAMRATFLRNDLESFFKTNAGEMVALVDGDATRLPDLIDFWMDRLEKKLNEYATGGEFTLPTAVVKKILTILGD